jgi:hypothetical protein
MSFDFDNPVDYTQAARAYEILAIGLRRKPNRVISTHDFADWLDALVREIRVMENYENIT